MAVLRVAAVLLACSCSLSGQDLEARIETAVRNSPSIARAFWGASVVDLDSGDVVISRNADGWFIPASTQKLFAAALALTRLGPEHRMRTRVLGEGELAAGGVWKGDLALVGDGDPTFCAPEFAGPLEPGSSGLPCLDSLAAHVAEMGLKRITGRVVGDDSAFLWEPYPEGWVESDLLWDYGAPVSALTLHRNTVYVRVRPGASPAEPAAVSTYPAVEFFQVGDRVHTAAAGGTNVKIIQGSSPQSLLVSGVIPAGKGASYPIAIRDPALYAATAFHQALAKRGVVVDQQATARHAYPPMAAVESKNAVNGPSELAAYESPPLVHVLREVLKNSQNLYAELALLAAARDGRTTTSRRLALQALLRFTRDIGLADEDFALEDGSGLSRLTLVTPRALTSLLAYMDRSEHAEIWRDLLPEGGIDGTLRNRFRGLAGAKIRAKTGTMTQVGALAGYISTARGRRFAFSLLVNNANLPAAVARQFIDTIVVELAQ